MNIVILSGHIATEPEERKTQSGKSVTSFRLAVNRGKDREADFFSVSAWEQKGEFIRRYWRKGDGIEIRGRLTTSVWEKDGAKQYTTSVMVEESHFPVGKRKKETTEPDGEPGTGFEELEDEGDLPF